MPLLSVDAIDVYYGDLQALRSVSLAVEKGVKRRLVQHPVRHDNQSRWPTLRHWVVDHFQELLYRRHQYRVELL